ncbi:MAG: FAD/NAD(P)-binding protein [Clostridiales bacterium]|jgi:NAD(P)H-flavin reductase|nr:FAD/NAD(P)-binding protein [Clostridiales bacterium]
MDSIYLPRAYLITDVIQETDGEVDVKTFRLAAKSGESLDFMPGQFVELTVPGFGEAPFGFASSPKNKDYVELSIKRVGVVTQAVHDLSPGDAVWLRGPFGNSFPVREMEGANILYVAGGLGLAPLRPLIDYVFHPENREKYGKTKLLSAARTPADFIYKYDVGRWKECRDFEIFQTIDAPYKSWEGRVGFPHELLKTMEILPDSLYAVVCGPPIMIKYTARALKELGVCESRIITTLEMRMSCGVGKCGKCNIGRRYVCVDGPVMRLSDLAQMPDEY